MPSSGSQAEVKEEEKDTDVEEEVEDPDQAMPVTNPASSSSSQPGSAASAPRCFLGHPLLYDNFCKHGHGGSLVTEKESPIARFRSAFRVYQPQETPEEKRFRTHRDDRESDDESKDR